MASLTPGVLSQLLQNVGNENVKVAGEHRSALLQVIGILPSFSSADDDPWKSKGFYLRVSDSVHSAYVSVSDSDAELILNDTIQLGQFVHVTRMDSGLPVPVLRGLKPVPKRRPCVGEPKDLISSEALQIRSRVDFSKKNARKAETMTKPKPKPKPKPSPKVEEAKRVLVGNGKIEGLDQLKRLSLDPTRKSWNLSPTRTSTAKSAVPEVKSKQPSLTPSRPSTSVGSRRSFSEKESTLEHTNSSITPIKNKNVIVSHRRSFSEKDLTLELHNSSITPLKNKNVIVSEKLISKPVKKDLKSSFECSIPSQFSKVPVSYKTWSDTNILWDSVPPAIQKLGKEVIYQRNVGFSAAVQALEETSASEGILQCMSVFAELHESARQDCTYPLVEPFLNLYQNTQKATDAINSLLDTMSEDKSGNLLDDTSKTFKNKNVALWVQAAIDTDLSNFSLFRKEDQNDLRNGNKTHFVILENGPPKAKKDCNLPKNKQLEGRNGPKTLLLKPRQHVRATKKQVVEREKWSKGQGLNDAANLAEKLLRLSRAWFLNYLEDSLKKGFGLKKGEEDSEIMGLLGQLKGVDEWLDESVGDESQMDERVDCLRKELYKFLLDHVDSAIVQAGN